MGLYSFLFLILSFFNLPVFGQQIGDFVYSSDISVESILPASLGYTLYLIQVQIADHSISSSIPLVQDDSLALIESIKALSSYQLVDAMRHSSDKLKTLDDYIASLKSTFYMTNASQRQLKSEISSLSSEISSCSKEKALYDKQYLEALESLSSIQELESLILLSQNSASCISSKQTLLNSKQHLSDLISNQISLLADKYDYLYDNREAIITHFDLLDADYLQKMIDIQKTLKKY